MKYILTLILIAGLCFGGYYFLKNSNATDTPPVVQENQDSIISYISKNISTLSPIKETVGGTFYVTNITVDRGFGTVEYEDGHNAYIANFTYTHSEKGEVEITNFVLTE